MFYKAIVVGAGPAGLFAAYNLSEYGLSTLVLEKNIQLGRKLLVSGSGQCNFTHAGDLEEFKDKYGDNFNFIKHALNVFTNKDSIKFFKAYGVDIEVTSSGKVFPSSRNSTDILDALVRSCKLNGAQIQSGVEINAILEYDGVFQVSTTDGDFFSTENLIIATGGTSFMHLGNDGFGYAIAQQFNHKVTKLRPSISNIISVETDYAAISGVSFKNVTMTIWHNEKKVRDKVGDLLFTHNGVSGPVVLNSTRWIEAGDLVTFNLVNKPYEVVQKELEQDLIAFGKDSIGLYLRKFAFPRSFIAVLLSILSIPADLHCANISRENRKKIATYMTKLPINVASVGDLNSAVVTCGGVSLKELNPTTLESRKQRGLYFIGEVIDIDADTGGYNIQAAMSMGCVCANSIIRKEQIYGN
ncbi:NAD(P)/FAD-dependent oxidoreductase [Candidatus Epulonipiscium viviparus]|uniref:NAD(P)/FAD-dependent oxidoreductase n=1 Tax=Candidatus Epulonipiscium viviparus TaxID=420336 RepID=UPI00016C08B3|nr:NAD(P)/FAD-dependent oxidoreductase [Candidatus Epulopiscium viviparus]